MGKLKRIIVYSLAFFSLIITSGCNPTIYDFPLIDVILENQTNQMLTIYYGLPTDNPVRIGNVAPEGKIVIKDLSFERGQYGIKAVNLEGQTIFSEIFTFKNIDKYHLEKVGDRVYKAVIPPLPIIRENTDNQTGK